MEVKNKLIAITGSTGGLGKNVCQSLAGEGANFIFIDRNLSKSKSFANKIIEKYPQIKIDFVTCDFSDFESVKNAIKELESFDIDVLILNSGIFNVPVKKLDSGFNNIFQVNFLYQYFLARFLAEKNVIKKVVAVGSVAYKCSKFNANDIDYSTSKKDMKIYGNSKRFLMFSLCEHFKEKNISFSLAHPGITQTNMTSHYPKWINWFVKICMTILFTSSKKAARNIVCAVKEDCDYCCWIGPRIFNIWGKPKQKKIKGVNELEKNAINEASDNIYQMLTPKN